MKAEDKARELVEKYQSLIETPLTRCLLFSIAKECAIIAVDEILKSFESFMDSRKHFRHPSENEAIEYWQQVKSHINKL